MITTIRVHRITCGECLRLIDQILATLRNRRALGHDRDL